MGLDQNIYKFTPSQKAEHEDPTNEDPSRPEQIIYWRKQNHFHRWMQTNLNEGVSTNLEFLWMDGEQIAGLVATCEQVLQDHSLANELLPTGDGFFFGSTDYDEWYFKSLEEAVSALKAALGVEMTSMAAGNPPNYFAYDSWW